MMKANVMATFGYACKSWFQITSFRIITTLVHDGTYSGNRFRFAKEDIVDVIVKIWSTDGSKISVNLMKTLNSNPMIRG